MKFIYSILLIFSTLSVAQEHGVHLGALHQYDFSVDNIKSYILPKKLKEVSGLATAKDNRYFTHNDESGKIFEIDPSTGNIINEFNLGNKKLKKDFEGIAAVNDSLYMVTSSGVIYKFSIPDDEQNVEYKKFKTFLSQKYDVEGLCYNKTSNSLLLACKGFAGKNLKSYRAVYSYNLNTFSLNEEPAYLINLETLKSKFNIKNFAPSGIEVHPETGNLFLISANQRAIVELSKDGDILNAVKLDKKLYKQPEGITISTDGSIIIADEGKGGKGFITIINKK